ELTWYDNGVVAVNKLFGNYDYGNGCLLEYKPSQIALEAQSRVDMETKSCAWNAAPSTSPVLALVTVSDSQAELSWSAIQNAEFYRIYRDGVAVSSLKELSFTDSDLGAQTRYSYQIEACNSHGCAKEKSLELLVETTNSSVLIPQPPALPDAQAMGSKINVISWQPVASASFYQVWRDGELMADNLTEVSYSDTQALVANTEYRYAIKACSEHGCSEQSESAVISTLTLDQIDVRVQHKDPTTPNVTVNIWNQNGPSSKSFFSANRDYSADGVYRYNRGVYSGGRYKGPIKAHPAKGQICSSNRNGLTFTNGKNVEILIDCLTQATLSSNLAGKQIDFILADNLEYYLPKPSLHRVKDGAEIITRAMIYQSSDESVLRIDEQGKITLVGAGEAQIIATADPAYYDITEPLRYNVTVAPPKSEQSVIVQRVEIGQAAMLTPGAAHQILAPKGKTLVRAYVYTPEGQGISVPEVSLTLSANGQSLRKTMHCPSTAKIGSFSTPSYDLTETCYSIIEGEDAANFIVNGMTFQIDTAEKQSLSFKPKVNINGTINVRLIPGIDADGNSRPVDAESFKNTLLQTYPLSTANVSVRDPYPLSTDPGSALNQVEAVRRLETDGLSYFYGLMTKSCYGTTGVASVGAVSAVGVDSRCGTYRDSTFTHELGHNLGLNHAPGCGVSSSESFWKSNAWPGVSRAALSPAPLFQKAENIVIAPTDSRVRRDSDLMNYCFGYRFSEYNYQRVADYINAKSWFGDQPVRQRALQASESMLIISGEIIDGKVVLQPTMVSNNPSGAGHNTIGDSEFTLMVNAADGVMSYPLVLMDLDHDDRKMFFMEVPASAKINALKIFAGDAELPIEIDGLAEQKAQASRLKHSGPTISYQAGQLVWDNATYPWLTVVHTKADGSRHTLALKQTGGEFILETKGLTEGSLHVSLSDGLNNVTYTEILGK
ncbi:MAG: chitinase N-terminal domain-containing protein, partial [Aeromonas sp.]